MRQGGGEEVAGNWRRVGRCESNVASSRDKTCRPGNFDERGTLGMLGELEGNLDRNPAGVREVGRKRVTGCEGDAEFGKRGKVGGDGRGGENRGSRRNWTVCSRRRRRGNSGEGVKPRGFLHRNSTGDGLVERKQAAGRWSEVCRRTRWRCGRPEAAAAAAA